MTRLDKRGKPDLQLDATDVRPEDYRYKINYGTAFSEGRSIRSGKASLDEAMLMIDLCMHMYEMTYEPHKIDTTLLNFPCWFSKPDPGAEIKNKTTGEVYTVADVVLNPYTKMWEGLVRINAINPPLRNSAEKLALTDETTNRVRFVHEFPEGTQTEAQGDDEIMKDVGPVAPTVTWALVREEPGTYGKSPFHPAKIYKPRVHEYVKDPGEPGHSIEVRTQWLDCLVQFDCWTADNFSATKLAGWFKRFMSLYIPVLKYHGVAEVLYWQQRRDAAVTKWRQDLISRTLQYFLRTEDISTIVRKDFVQIDLTLAIKSKLKDESVGWIAGQKVDAPMQMTKQEYDALFRNSDGEYLFGDVSIIGP